MTRVSSKFQVTLPKSLADRYGIRPGDEIGWEVAGEIIQLATGSPKVPERSVDRRLASFDQATKRQAEREQAGRGWSREDLY